MVEKNTAAGYNRRQIYLFQPVEEQPSNQKAYSLPHIPEHKTKEEGIGDTDQYGGIDLIVCRQTVHLYEHLKGLKKPGIMKLGGRFAQNVVVVIFQDTESFFHR